MPTDVALAKDYPTLRKKVHDTLLLGQQRIEEAKVLTYWQAGKLISDHILHYEHRENYGQRIIEQLSEDLGESRVQKYLRQILNGKGLND